MSVTKAFSLTVIPASGGCPENEIETLDGDTVLRSLYQMARWANDTPAMQVDSELIAGQTIQVTIGASIGDGSLWCVLYQYLKLDGAVYTPRVPPTTGDLLVPGKNWPEDYFWGKNCYIWDGTGKYSYGGIIGNTADTLHIWKPAPDLPDATSKFLIMYDENSYYDWDNHEGDARLIYTATFDETWTWEGTTDGEGISGEMLMHFVCS